MKPMIIPFSLRFLCVYVVSFLWIGAACSWAADTLQIVTTTTNLASIAQAVGGDHVSAVSISGGDVDPHFIQAKPSYMMKAHRADLWIRIGLQLEIGYERLILEGARNPRIRVGSPGHLDVSEDIAKLEIPTIKVDRSLGDVHPLGNPHYWLDPYNGRITATEICHRLQQLDPQHAVDYDHNLAAFMLKVDKAMFGPALVQAFGGEKLWQLQSDGTLDRAIQDYNHQQRPAQPVSLGGWLARLAPFTHAKIVVYHRSWPYFFHRFGLDDVAELEPKPGIPPGPAHLLEVINTIKAQHARVILMEPFYNRAHADSVARKTDAKVVVVPTAVDARVQDYVAMLDNIVNQLAEALQ